MSLFEVENLRDRLARQKKYKEFKATYSTKYPQIPNKNTGKFWDEKFKSPESLNEQDWMTKDKVNTVVSFLPKRKIKILDLGIGQGYLEQKLQELEAEHTIYGLDISKKVIKRLEKKFKGDFKAGDILKADKFYKRNYFDVIVAIEVIEHIPPHKIFSFYKIIYLLLKKNGLFIISTPLNEGLRDMDINPSAHVREYTPEILDAEFNLAGLKIEKIKTFIAFKNLYFIKKFIAKFTKKWKPNNIVIVAKKTS